MAALSQADLTGGGLRLGAVRERTGGFTSYDVTFVSTTTGASSPPLRVSGVLDVPTGPGQFPAVVLAHGYIHPAYYVRGQGMTRERGFLADRGFVALHVDHRNHAESTDDPRMETAVRLGNSADVIATARALQKSGGGSLRGRASASSGARGCLCEAQATSIGCSGLIATSPLSASPAAAKAAATWGVPM